MLCGEALSGLTGSMKMVKFDVGNEFEVITVSFNPQETQAIAAAKKAGLSQALRARGCRCGLAFSDRTGRVDQRADQGGGIPVSVRRQVESVCACHGDHGANAAGTHLAIFLWRGLSAQGFAHGAGRGFAGKIGNAVDAVLLYCYHYDPATGKYGAIVNNILKLGAGITILILAVLLFILFRLEKAAPPRRPLGHATKISEVKGSTSGKLRARRELQRCTIGKGTSLLVP